MRMKQLPVLAFGLSAALIGGWQQVLVAEYPQDQQESSEQAPVSAGMFLELIHPDQSEGHVIFEFSPDGSKVIGGTYPGGILAVWDATTGELLTRIEPEPSKRGSNKYFHVSPDWSTVYVAGFTMKLEEVEENGLPGYRIVFAGSVEAWDMTTGELQRTYQHDPPRGIIEMALLSNGRYLATVDELWDEENSRSVRRVSIWNAADGTRRELPEGISYLLDVTPDGKLIAFRERDEDDSNGTEVLLIDPETLRTTLSFSQPNRDIDEYVSTFTPDGKLMLGRMQRNISTEPPGLWDLEIIWWDARSGAELQRSLIGGNLHLSRMGFSPDSQWMAVADHVIPARKLYLFRTGDQSLRHTIDLAPASDKHRTIVRRPVFSPDGKWVVVCMNRVDKQLNARGDLDALHHPRPNMSLIDVEAGRIVKEFTTPHGWTIDPKFSPDGKTLAIGAHGKVTLWNWEEMIKDVE